MKECKTNEGYTCGAYGSYSIPEVCGAPATNVTSYQTGAVRDTGGKGRMDLLPMCALIRISRHMENTIKPDPETGVAHYPERNWEKGLPMHSMIDSAFRHMAKYMDGQIDEDHLCAATTNLLMAMWMEEKHPEMQDIPTRQGLTTQAPLTISCKGGDNE